MMAALLLAVLTANVPPPGVTLRCHAWVAERGGARQEVTCPPINSTDFAVPSFSLPEPGIGQVVTYCVEAVSTSGAVSECVPASQVISAPAPPRGPFMPVPQ